MTKTIIALLLLISVVQAESRGHMGPSGAFGIGSGSLKTKIGLDSDRDNTAVVLFARIGAGIYENVVLNFDTIGSIGTGEYGAIGKNDVNCDYAGVGVTYYLNNTEASPYIAFSIGSAEHTTDPKSNFDSSGKFGQSYRLATGYEYNGWLGEISYLRGVSQQAKSDLIMYSIGYNFIASRWWK